jgi:hypothetical protein
MTWLSWIVLGICIALVAVYGIAVLGIAAMLRDDGEIHSHRDGGR